MDAISQNKYNSIARPELKLCFMNFVSTQSSSKTALPKLNIWPQKRHKQEYTSDKTFDASLTVFDTATNTFWWVLKKHFFSVPSHYMVHYLGFLTAVSVWTSVNSLALTLIPRINCFPSYSNSNSLSCYFHHCSYHSPVARGPRQNNQTKVV